MHRFFIPPQWIQGSQVLLADPVAHQLRAVLRMSPGDQIMVLDNRGAEYEIELVALEKQQVIGRVISQRQAAGEPTTKITLYQSLLKKENFEWVLQKCTEVGVTHFVPFISQRSVSDKLKDSKMERWERILTEAAEQSRRGNIPTLQPLITFDEALKTMPQFDLVLIPFEDEQQTSLRRAITAAKPRTLAIFIGPEGGFSAGEITRAKTMGVIPVTLGTRILRAETAAVVAAANVLYELENN